MASNINQQYLPGPTTNGESTLTLATMLAVVSSARATCKATRRNSSGERGGLGALILRFASLFELFQRDGQRRGRGSGGSLERAGTPRDEGIAHVH